MGGFSSEQARHEVRRMVFNELLSSVDLKYQDQDKGRQSVPVSPLISCTSVSVHAQIPVEAGRAAARGVQYAWRGPVHPTQCASGGLSDV